MNTNKNHGVVQQFSLEADTKTALLAACMIALTEHDFVTHYEDTDVSLTLHWHGNAKRCVKLAYGINGINSAEELADFVVRWLERTAEYPECPYTYDGDAVKGFKFSCDGWSTFATVEPCWIIYGK